MKRFLLLILVLISSPTFADTITIDAKTYDVEIKKVTKSKVIFELNGEQYAVPFKNFESLYLGTDNQNYDGIKESLLTLLNQRSPCLVGTMDAQKRGKTAIYFAGGFMVFGYPQDGMTNFHPAKDFTHVTLRGNVDLITDDRYIACYKRQAKANAVSAYWKGLATYVSIVGTVALYMALTSL